MIGERRLARRYSIGLTAQVGPERRGGSDDPGLAFPVRDISSQGISVYQDGAWNVGDRVHLGIGIGEEICSPFSYRFEAAGTVVRTDSEPGTGRGYCAMAFNGPGAIRDWHDNMGEGGR